jgi:hypothetical protein
MPEVFVKIAEKLLEPASDLIKRTGGPVADEIGEYLAASVRPYTVVRQVEAVAKAQQMLNKRGLSTHPVPPRLLLPILEGASIEDEEDLHTRWAALLANAASSDKVHPSYIEVLKQLTPAEARLLDALYKIAKGKPWQTVDTTAVTDEEFKASGPRLFTWFSNLIRLGLIQISFDIERNSREIKVRVPNIDMSKWQGYAGVEGEGYFDGELEETYLFTQFAVDFVNACRAPKTLDAP